MIQHHPSRNAPAVLLTAALLTLACTGAPQRGMPLYPNASATPLPPSAVAQLIGPIGTVDGRDVFQQGGMFELLPGCHVVELDRRPKNSDNLASSVYLTGQYPLTTYAIRMKGGASYVIRRYLANNMGPMVVTRISAQEEDATGRVTELNPIISADEIHACTQ